METEVQDQQYSVPPALSAKQLARILNVSLRHIRQMDARQLLPRPCRLGRAVRWPADEVHDWMRAGMPDRRTWEKVCKDQEGSQNHV